MAMSYSSLIAAKGASGAIATWSNYSLLDIGTIVDEAQLLLYSEGRLRTREMKTSFDFTMPQYGTWQELPTGFLDPIGKIFCSSFNTRIAHKDESTVKDNRTYTENSGTLSANPFTTTSGSAIVSVYLPSHNLTQDSVFETSGATAFNGITIAGTFPVNAITDTDDFTIDTTILGTLPTASTSGGGGNVSYTSDSLNYGSPVMWGIWDERINFDQAFYQQSLCRLHYFQSLPLLSSTNQTNFLTTRYPKLLRIACMASAAEFMKDDTEYQKWLTRLQSATEAVSNENDMEYRGMELDTYTP